MPKLAVSDNDAEQDILNMHVESAIENADDDAEFNEQPSQQQQQTTQGALQDIDQGIDTQPGQQQTATQTAGAVDTGLSRANATNQPGQQTQTQTQVVDQQQTHAEQSFARPVRADQQGNFVDPQTGQVVARAGAERRMFERARRVEGELTNTRSQLQQARHEVQRLSQAIQQQQQQQPQEPAIITSARQRGISDNELQVGLDIVAQIKTDPIAGARFVLQSAMAQGYNLEQIIGTQDGVPNSALDMGAVRNMINSAVEPLTNAQQQQQQREQQQNDAQQQYNTFVATHEHASVHMDAIATLCKNNPNLSPERAYYEVKMFAAQNGLDFSQPLGPQVAMRSAPVTVDQMNQQLQTQQTQQTQQRAPMQPNQPPLPTSGVSSDLNIQTHGTASSDDDWDSIISQSMQEAGMRR